MINDNRVKEVLFGGDYNPEQWDYDTWLEDMRLLKLANINILTINVFSWATLQPSENEYNFEKLDKILKMVKENGFKVCLATSTGAHPAWMAKKYPEVTRTEYNGAKRKFGGRHNSCPNSEIYRKYSERLAHELSARYKDYENIVGWHISNEYGGECYCENCEKAFRVWLKDKYKTIDELNRAWNTAFWGHIFYEWDEVVLPNQLSEEFGFGRSNFQGISLDYKRFNNESILDCYKLEYDAIRNNDKINKITTNFMLMFKPLDYQKWSKYLDFVSWDSYPSIDNSPSFIAMNHGIFRGLKQGQPFILMEQTPSTQNWMEFNRIRRTEEMRLLSYQALAHGSDSVMYFQMRRSIGACEKMHGAVIDHVGNEHTRVFKGVQQLGQELKQLGDLFVGGTMKAKVAMVFDWDNWWAVETSSGPSSALKYPEEVEKYYTAFHKLNINANMISVDDDLTEYDLVVAPLLYMTKTGFDEKIRSFVKNGGTFLTSYFSGIVNENDLVITGGYPGKLRDILGIWVEEIDALFPDEKNSFNYNGKEYDATLLCDILHLENAKSLGNYNEDFYKGHPVVTENIFGNGLAYYVATRSTDDFYLDFIKNICDKLKIQPTLETDYDVEVTCRYKNNKEIMFILNHSKDKKIVKLNNVFENALTKEKYTNNFELEVKGQGIYVLEREI